MTRNLGCTYIVLYLVRVLEFAGEKDRKLKIVLPLFAIFVGIPFSSGTADCQKLSLHCEITC